ncbi:hypothetical protein BpHYR1_015165 [Brachionus plicatilis]|uniref:Uncharacterized protein n=1 Tax=Brachionus plicatilis TaxID=10195 RepID=A0A3M7RTH4_BRAPC|nr:hypothetical protein BpHYR1_015165 [Brachionus plicatilis]
MLLYWGIEYRINQHRYNKTRLLNNIYYKYDNRPSQTFESCNGQGKNITLICRKAFKIFEKV